MHQSPGLTGSWLPTQGPAQTKGPQVTCPWTSPCPALSMAKKGAPPRVPLCPEFMLRGHPTNKGSTPATLFQALPGPGPTGHTSQVEPFLMTLGLL